MRSRAEPSRKYFEYYTRCQSRVSDKAVLQVGSEIPKNTKQRRYNTVLFLSSKERESNTRSYDVQVKSVHKFSFTLQIGTCRNIIIIILNTCSLDTSRKLRSNLEYRFPVRRTRHFAEHRSPVIDQGIVTFETLAQRCRTGRKNAREEKAAAKRIVSVTNARCTADRRFPRPTAE